MLGIHQSVPLLPKFYLSKDSSVNSGDLELSYNKSSLITEFNVPVSVFTSFIIDANNITMVGLTLFEIFSYSVGLTTFFVQSAISHKLYVLV